MRVVAVHVNVGGEFTGIHNILGDASRNAEGTGVGRHHRAGGDDGAGPHECLGADPTPWRSTDPDPMSDSFSTRHPSR